MRKFQSWVFFLLYLTLGTYAVPELRFGSGQDAVPYAVPLSLILLVVVAITAVMRHGRDVISFSLVLWILFYVCSILAGGIVALTPSWVLMGKYTLMSLLPILASLVVRENDTFDTALLCLLVSSIAVAGYGAYGFFSGKIGDPTEHMLGYYGVTYQMSTRNSDMLYIQTAFWLLLGSIILPRSRNAWLLRFLSGALLTATAAAAVLSMVRGTWISMALVLVLVIAFTGKSKMGPRRVLSMAGLIVAVALGLRYLATSDQIHALVSRFGSIFVLSSEGGNSNLSRIALTNNVLNLIARHPVAGVGVGNLRYYLLDFQFGSLNHAENVYLQIWAEQGILGVLAVLGLLSWTIVWLFRGYRSAPAEKKGGLLGLLALVINWALYGVFNNLNDSVWFWSVIALAAGVANLHAVQSAEQQATVLKSRRATKATLASGAAPGRAKEAAVKRPHILNSATYRRARLVLHEKLGRRRSLESALAEELEVEWSARAALPQTGGASKIELRILFVAPRYDYGNPARGFGIEENYFFQSLLAMGHEMVRFDPLELQRKYGHKMMNQMLVEAHYRFNPDVVFSVLFKDEIDYETMRGITEKGTSPTLNWFCDDHWRFENFSRLWAPYYSWIITTAKSALSHYKAANIQNVILSQWGCNHWLYYKMNLPQVYDVSFVGQPHGNRRTVIERLRKAGLKVNTWGYGWEAGRLTQSEMVCVFNQSKINLNLSNSSVAAGQQVKGRNFEIPGCGAFLMTDFAENLGEYYELGKEIVCFDNLDNLVEKARYYLAHEEERQAIAEAGYQRTLREHTYQSRFEHIFRQIGLIN